MTPLPHDRHDESSYGERIAGRYDDIYDGIWDTEAAVDGIMSLVDGSRVLELGVGTGRIALPLARRSCEVWGIDGSQDMLDLMAAKADGHLVTPLLGDFATTTADGLFDAVLLLVNTVYAMPTQDDQVACFENAARHLRPGGRFILEAWVPDPPRRDRLALKARRLGSGLAGLVVEDHDPARQTLSTTQIVIDPDGKTLTFPVVHRYAWPAELDLMARICGMTLEHRWGSWDRRPFDWSSTDHISVWRTPLP